MFFRSILVSLWEESQRLYVTGPKSERARRDLQERLDKALLAYADYRRFVAAEERIGG